jgi:hypothetical protein
VTENRALTVQNVETVQTAESVVASALGPQGIADREEVKIITKRPAVIVEIGTGNAMIGTADVIGGLIEVPTESMSVSVVEIVGIVEIAGVEATGVLNAVLESRNPVVQVVGIFLRTTADDLRLLLRRERNPPQT